MYGNFNNNPLNVLSQFMQMGNNPQAILQNLINQNPQAKFYLNQMKSSGLSDKEFVMQFAKNNNIDINPFIGMLSNFGIKL